MTDSLAIYIHWPFCQSKCPYCDFNSHVWDDIEQATWRNALASELNAYAAETGGRQVSSIYFGGGTPSLMAAETASALIDRAGDHWGFTKDIEITLEANPSSSEASKFRDFKKAGVNRLSIGVQAFDDEALRFLGRRHNADEATRALHDARETFERFSFDMIYGLPGQSVDAWQATLGDAIAMAGDHLSLYQLTIEPGTPFFRDKVKGADEDTAADLFEITRSMMADAGLPAYEVSNHAQPGGESRHNLTYWRGGDYVGIGPGAHGRITSDGRRTATHQIHDPMRWMEKVTSDGHGTAKRRSLSQREHAEECVMTGLRMREGLDLNRLSENTGIDHDRIIDGGRLKACIDAGFIRRDGDILAATETGMARLNALLATLLIVEAQIDA